MANRPCILKLYRKPNREASNQPATATIPAGLPFTIALTQPINTATATAGDPLSAKLAAAIRNADNKVLLTKGTVILARIVQIERLYGIIAPRVQSLRVGIKIESSEVDGVGRPF